LVLAVSYGKPDQGTLRLIAVDALQFRSPVANVIAQPPTATDQNPIGAQPSPSPERTATVARTSQTRGQSPNDAQPSLQPPAKESEPQANIAELKHTISSLRSELATSTAKVTRLENQLLESERQLKQEAQGRLNAEAAKRQTEQAMLQTRNATQLWTILANANIASNLPDLDQWLGYFERWLSSILEKVPVPREFSRANSGGLSVKNVAETEVTAQPS
jgi:flagellar biosynthesis GTPase FlhF